MSVRNVYDLPFKPSSEAEGGASVPFARIFGKEDMDSDLRWLDYCIVKPGAEIGFHAHLVDDEIYYIVKGQATKIVNAERATVRPGDAILLKCGGSHGLKNDSDEEVHVLVVDLLAPPESNQRLLVRNIDAVPLTAKRSKGGSGEILVGHLFTPDELGPAWDFMLCVKLPPGSAIGAHTHSGDDEIYYIVDGRGTLLQDGVEYAVTPGSASLCRSGSNHGLRADPDSEVTLLAVQARIHPATDSDRTAE